MLGGITLESQALLSLIRQHDPNALRVVSSDRRVYYIVKRVLDIFIASILLVFLSPLMLLLAVLIFIYSPGPVFFIQERVGAKRQHHSGYLYWKKTTFPCYKFRTMKKNADPTIHREYVKALIDNDKKRMSALQNVPTEVRKLVRDPRIIRPGWFLRKLSLDELPQLWNVLRGEMSLVGPRPAIPYEVEMYKPWHLKRLEAQPGITGLQQVTARCTEDYDHQVQLDIEYIEKQCLWLDTKIILKTPLVIITTKGAH
jgi:lipopolysaccharide/colanic/teichoic acid biosynthesis glycosyltransferase